MRFSELPGRNFALFALLIVTVAGTVRPVRAEKKETSTEKAAKILARRCISCHNTEKKIGGLDLSTRQAALAKTAFVPRDAGKSLLLKRVTAGTMPPAGKLPEAEIVALRQWLTDGGDYPKEPLQVAVPQKKPLWSFQPVKRFAVPKTKFDALARTPIDHFVFARIEHNGLRPSPQADRRILLRRVTIDLTGLPPTPAEVRAFLADKSSNAYEKVVSRLLASSAYGERQARHWLDVVRYGESHGYEQNHLRPKSWPYRDYVIRAFNKDIPYSQFVTEQLAGDIVGKGDAEREVGTGYLVAGIHDTVGIQTEEGTRQQRANDLEDMVATTGATFLGLTVGCAKCHDHKFDPIPQRDYYRMAAVFADVRHAERSLPDRPLLPEQKREIANLNRQIETLSAQITALEAKAGNSSKNFPRPSVNVRRNEDTFAPVSARFVRFSINAVTGGSEPCLDELQIFGPNNQTNLALASNGAKATASSLLPGYAIHQVAHLNDGKFGNEWSWISSTANNGWAQIELPLPAKIARVVWSRDANGNLQDRLATAYRIEVSPNGTDWQIVATEAGRSPLTAVMPSPEEIAKALPPAQKQQWAELNAKRESLRLRLEFLKPPSAAYIGQFAPPDPIYVLKRGDVMQRGEEVSPGALSMLALTKTNGPNVQARNIALEPFAGKVNTEENPRLALARWLCDDCNPLTARVLVNRLWAQHFGRGLVGTPSDFGNNGEAPSHPELLDWLANDFMANGWKMKRLHRLLVTSYAYRQASAVTREGSAKDADNRLLWRMPLRRAEAEVVRDAILQTSGKLDRTMGGPSFRLYDYRIYNVAIYTPRDEQGPETWRRTVYQQPARGIRDNLLGTLDCPDSSERAAKRTSTTTALQALSLFNGPFVNEQADFLAARVRQEARKSVPAQIQQAFWLAFGRAPDAREQQKAAALIQKYGLPTLCRALFNANEFLYY